jgi:glycine cleavage system H protein
LEVPADLSYTADDEWIRFEGNEGVIGITDYAQDQLGDIVYVELPAVGATFQLGAPFGVVESVKAVADLFAPIGGSVVETNTALSDSPELVNGSPYDEGWLIRLRLDEPADRETLLDAERYRETRPEAEDGAS